MSFRVGLLTIGDELLIGQVLNTNAQWISEKISGLGHSITHHLTVGDQPKSYQEALAYLVPKVDVLLIGGGLGPTHDDITMEEVSKFFKVDLEYDAEWISKVEDFFKSRNRIMPENNRKQGYLLKGATRIDNDCGTAAGQDFLPSGGPRVFIFPGVPYEMKSMMSRHILPELSKNLGQKKRVQHTFLVTGIGESALAEKLSEEVKWIQNDSRFQLAFLPSPQMIRLRVTCDVESETDVQDFELFQNRFVKALGKYYFGEGEMTLQKAVVDLLKERRQTLSTAESCTGGLISHLLTQVPGASDVFRSGFVCYTVDQKLKHLGVSAQKIEQFGVVSREVAIEMALGALRLSDSDFALATTGFAGPTGGDSHAALGQVWIAVVSRDGRTYTETYTFEPVRERHKERTAVAAMDSFRRGLLE